MKRFACVLMLLALQSGCYSTGRHPYYASAEYAGTGGAPSAYVIEGGFVETIVVDDGFEVNVQVTKNETHEWEGDYALKLDHELTIGRFSQFWGSGFTSRANIYYENDIDYSGNDSFTHDGVKYRVTWDRDGRDWATGSDHTPFVITIQAMGKVSE